MHKVDERGKYFTDRVHTHLVDVVIVTLRGQVLGKAHLMPGQRIKDMLNSHDDAFIALTDATLTNSDSSTQQIKFMLLNKSHIISVVPLQEDTDKTQQDEYAPY